MATSAEVIFLFITCISTGSSFHKPNFVLFLADDMGFADLQIYGNPLSKTPNIDKLARDGLKFTQFYSASSVCSPSRAGLLTGRYPVRSGVWNDNDNAVFHQDNTEGLPHEEITIAEMLARQGYTSGHIGKWHLGVGYQREFLPLQHGFDRYFGIPHTHSDCPCQTCFYPTDPCDSEICTNFHAPCQLMNGNTIVEQPVDLVHLSERQARAARSWIQEYSCSGTPFFLYYAFAHTHAPNFAGERFRNTTIGGDYTDSLAELDWEVGEVIDELEKCGLRENTLIILTSDNGPALSLQELAGFTGPMRCGKGSTFEGGHRVPTIINWPGHVRSGISTEFLSQLDIWPTIRSLSGLLPDDIDVVLDGFDFSNILFSNEKSLRTSMLYYPKNPQPNRGPIGLRDERYKIHDIECKKVCSNNNGETVCDDSSANSFLLYDLLLDPEERNELSSLPAFQATINEMALQMERVSSDIEFADSVLMNLDKSSQMCCNEGCEPYPSCCSCDSKYSDDLFPLDQLCKKNALF
ncbi:arylsulfatase A-like [Anneissia japonica]|uniref:arylsulfatase A-like n=1 Tax=Anneissia japonica TaxID=1529436 RepID=UPI0014256563|nr:arylsulfatase A-like [Anneissia japonica]